MQSEEMALYARTMGVRLIEIYHFIRCSAIDVHAFPFARQESHIARARTETLIRFMISCFDHMQRT